MTSSRTQAVVLLAAALLCGGVGGYALKSMDHGDDRPRFEARGWMRGLDLTQAQVDTINAIWRRNEQAINELTEARIGPQKDSLWEIIHPAWDSLYGSIRLAVDSIRTRTRAETRAALPEMLRVNYDSIVAVADSTRRKELEMRNAGRRDGSGRGGPPGGPGGPGGQGRGGPGRGGGGPPGGSGHGSYF